MDSIDLYSFRLPNEVIRRTKVSPPIIPTIHQEEWFIRGPLSGPWLGEAARLPGHALHVALTILYVQGMNSGKNVVVSRFHFARFATAKGPTKRGLDELRKAGLIAYTKEGQKFKVTVFPVKQAANESSTD